MPGRTGERGKIWPAAKDVIAEPARAAGLLYVVPPHCEIAHRAPCTAHLRKRAARTRGEAREGLNTTCSRK